MEWVVGVEKMKLQKLVIHEFYFRLAFDRDVVFYDIYPLICVVESRRGAVAWAIRPKGGRPMKRMTLAMVLLVLVAVGLWAVPADAMTAEELESACRPKDGISIIE